ncbi:efflux RND transporter periplasmic adaptor subunit [Roseovarius dicentrarchi]|uniref:efflux RND transporter periplasmic adaptor subunit n=1 Tax=Roseovarius dicentrarchi TaxID=2250573 RepID=UPI000DEAACA1|nr:efflux RND transporter periplasmic adaptor subunit [Roseovarius dicentrarchi]
MRKLAQQRIAVVQHAVTRQIHTVNPFFGIGRCLPAVLHPPAEACDRAAIGRGGQAGNRRNFLTLLSERRNTLAKRNALPDTQAKETALELAVAIQDLDRARMAIDMAGLEVAQARALLAQKAITSPIAGVVTERLANKGEFRNGETDIATIARIDQLRVEAYAPISHYPRLSIGQSVQVIPEAPLDEPRRATIRVIDRVFDAATATFGLRMELDNADLSLPAGLRCTLHFPQG